MEILHTPQDENPNDLQLVISLICFLLFRIVITNMTFNKLNDFPIHKSSSIGKLTVPQNNSIHILIFFDQ